MTTSSATGHALAEPAGPASYQVGASSPTGLWLGLGGPALGLLGAGLLLSVLAALTRLPVGVSLLPILLAASLALLPVAGRPLHVWAGPAISYLRTHLGGQHRWRPSPVAFLLTATSDRTAGAAPIDDGDVSRAVGTVRLRLPAEYGHPVLIGELSGPDITVDAVVGAAGPGLLVDRRSGTVTMVFAVAGTDRFALLDSPEQDRLLASWGSALTLLSRDPAVRRVQLLDRRTPHPRPSRPGLPVPEIAYRPGDPSLPGAGGEVSSSPGDVDYQRLQAQVRALTVHRDSLLAVQLRLDALGSLSRTAGAGHRTRQATELLTAARERAQHLTTVLLTGQLLCRPLGPAELTTTLAGFLTGQLAAPDPTSGWPGRAGLAGLRLIASRHNGWDHVRLDDSWHRSYAITDWPRTPSTGAWLAPLLLATPTGSASTFAVHLEPIRPAQAARLARSARTRADLDLADRHKLGLPPSAAADLTAEGAAGMDAELVAGHSAHRMSALLTCSAESLPQLQTASEQLHEAALAARLQIRPLHGQHQLALAATLPLCRLRTTTSS